MSAIKLHYTEFANPETGLNRLVDEFFCKLPIRLFSDNSWVYIKE